MHSAGELQADATSLNVLVLAGQTSLPAGLVSHLGLGDAFDPRLSPS